MVVTDISDNSLSFATMVALFFLLVLMAIRVHSDMLNEDTISFTPQFKFHPELWLMGARKRHASEIHSPHISPAVLTNMRKFFKDLREDIELHTQNYDDYDMVADSPVKNEIIESNNDFTTQSKNRGTRKGSLNPSLLWKGLGRK